MYASLVGMLVAATLTLAQRIFTMHEIVDAWYGGVRATSFGMIILVLAWTFSDVTEQLSTAAYLVSVLANSLSVALVPAIVFVLAAITAPGWLRRTALVFNPVRHRRAPWRTAHIRQKGGPGYHDHFLKRLQFAIHAVPGGPDTASRVS
jgi:hypothetical protein